MHARLAMLLLAVAPLPGCGVAADPVAVSVAMPTLADVTSSNVRDRSCACAMRTGTCAMVADAVPGYHEARNLHCAVVSGDESAVRCRFEERFVIQSVGVADQPGPWRAIDSQFRRLPGGWCAG